MLFMDALHGCSRMPQGAFTDALHECSSRKASLAVTLTFRGIHEAPRMLIKETRGNINNIEQCQGDINICIIIV